MTVTPVARYCHYCGDRGVCVAWPSRDYRVAVWACSDREACSRRARVLAVARMNETNSAA